MNPGDSQGDRYVWGRWEANDVLKQAGNVNREPILCPMRWLIIVLLVSVGALLIVSAGAAHHIWREHTERKRKRPENKEAVAGKADETEI